MAAESFSRDEDASQVLEASLREIQSKKDGASIEVITEVDEETVIAAFAREVPPHCLGEMVGAVLADYKD
ncbi:MAG: hypothetical protein LBO09_06150 [Candidatus Peribacteria bacterium]|nr:hypothetical protein [Candidatus Peribacteria bacterium]